MIRYAVQFPEFLMTNPQTDFNANRAVFVKNVKPVIYWPSFKYTITRGIGFKKYLKQSIFINPDEYDFAFNEIELNRKADVLLNFNTWPINIEHLTPPRRFNGLKIWHSYEFWIRSREVNKILESHGVDYLLAYSDIGKYSPFFQDCYPAFVEKVIPFPFGTLKKFLVTPDWNRRIQKVVAVGAVGPVIEPLITDDSMDDCRKFYAEKKWIHQWRRILVENEQSISDIVHSELPHYPVTKNFSYDALKVMSDYVMFANDESLFEFPPIRTFEGPAAGCVMISSDHPSYKDLGFEDGLNCIFHKKHDLSDFRDKATYYLNHPDLLKQISVEGQKLIWENYTHDQVVAKLVKQIENIYSTGKLN